MWLFVYKIYEMLKILYVKSAKPELEDKPRKLPEHIIKQLQSAGVKTV